ncbi:MAG TPA: hypothetical protein VF363_03440 [Candidatus Eisenbacteria bacterium]
MLHFRPVEGIPLLTARRPKPVGILVAAAFLLLSGTARASLLDYQPLSPNEIILAQRAIADSESAVPHSDPVAVASPPAAPLVPSTESHKSPGKAFLMDLVVPGAGHLYAGNKRGWAHLGLEGAAWVSYFYYHDRGKDKERQYIAHADDHWSYDRWVASYGGGSPPPDADSLIQYFQAHNKQHYYEDIVKLSTYAGGWDDPANRNFNRGIRNASNNFLKDARYAVTGSFLNRVVSSVDVFRILRSRGRASLGEDTQLRFKVHTKPFSNENSFGFEIRKRL